MSKNQTAKPGDFMQIPLEDGTFGYGKILVGEIKLLQLQTPSRDVTHDQLCNANDLFRIWVMNHVLKPKSSWNIVGHQSLTKDEKVSNMYFIEDKITGNLSIYHSSDNYPQRYKEWPATHEECTGLERAAVWEPQQVESRLLDHFEQRENKWVNLMNLK